MANIQAANEGTEPFSSFDELKEKKPEFVQSMSDVMTTMTGFTDELTDVDQQMLDTAHEILDNQGGLFSGWGQLADEARNQIALALESATTWSEVANDMDATTEQVDVLKNLLNEYFEHFGDEIGVSADRIQGWIEYNDDLMAAVEELGLDWDDLSQILQVLAGNEELAQGSTEELQGAIEEITPTEEDYSEATNNMAVVTEETADAMATAAQEGADAVNTSFEEGSKRLITTAEEMESGATEAMNPLGEDMATAGTEGGSGIDSSFREWLDPVNDAVFLMYGYFENQLGSGLSSNMMTWGYSAGEEFASGIDLSSWEISDTAYAIYSEVALAFAELEGDLYSSGYYAGQGFYNGLDEWYWSISNLAWDMANEIKNAANEALDIGSPSRVMMEIGEYAAEGWAIGFERGSEEALSSVHTMTDGVISLASDDNVISAIERSGRDYSVEMADLGSSESTDAQNTMNQIIFLLDKLSRMQMVTDTGVLVGELAEPMNQEFNAIRLREERG